MIALSLVVGEIQVKSNQIVALNKCVVIIALTG